MCGQAHEVLRYYCQKLGKGLCDPSVGVFEQGAIRR
jgi:hypothetical protein